MNYNEELIRKFYTAFQKLDYETMKNCYSDDPSFLDPAFGLLEGEAVGAMWHMLCTNARNFSLEFSDIRLLDEEYCVCNWTARYTFSQTGRRVVNNVKAHMRIQDGKITGHSDQFDIWKWSRQALGLPGYLLGWSGLLRRKIRKNARSTLIKFMKDHGYKFND